MKATSAAFMTTPGTERESRRKADFVKQIKQLSV
jgi:hypothetical protein